jgi:hypothetical protein
MLQTQTVEPRTFSLLTQLMKLPALADFYLVGGTALSLQFGHRISVDLDLFGHTHFDREVIIKVLEEEYRNDFSYDGKINSWGIFGFIRDVKVDIINYKHPVIQQPVTIDGIRMYSTEDIIAMKINAILGRSMKKDFWDVYELLKHYTIDQFISFHSKKFPSQQLMITIPQALVYFEDAEESEEPISLKGQTWEGVKKFIQQKVNDFLSPV